ncbi:ABC-2 type transport system ATP-binding protein [Bacillus ectoiniformans]|uniref:ABC transporter ATP-binding protein n=1 Tax=Bacillus ectoiniformans TaxID=1494429 RepID=UPI001957B767|nr:ABC transporter ATP-binding protein [Bacillus ectoiniformans]MBM7649771.1 ABC-2 type transport system ATP-binding protein [Bacillus ectoiniformans]
MIQFKMVRKQFKNKEVIQELSFEVKAGECFALCGGNGAGKSTLLKMLTGIYTPDSGAITLNGEPVNRTLDFKRQFAFMPDDLSFLPHASGRETLEFFAKLQKLPIQRAAKLLERVGLTEDADRKVKTYSKGMQQRLSFAQSLLSDAPILVLDEPTNGLDPFWVHRMKEMILEEKALGRTVLFTTHILSLVEEIADTLAFLQNGQLLVQSPVEDLLKSHSSLDAALFSEYEKKAVLH